MRAALIAALAVACSSRQAPPAAAPRPAPAARIGDPCTPSPDMRGTCGAGMFCLPAGRAPDAPGVCVGMCGTPACGAATACPASPRVSELCAATCASDGDCRAPGTACDPGWKVCAPPGFLAPKLAACAAAALPRRAFAPARQISSAAGPGVYDFEPAAALDASGNLTAVYIAGAHLGQKNALGVVTLAAGGAVDGDRALRAERENHFDPWMAAGRDGRLHAVFMAFDGGRAPEKRLFIALATSADGKSWTAPIAVHDEAADCPLVDGEPTPGCLDKPMIAIGPDRGAPGRDAMYVAYHSGPGGGEKLRRSADGGKTWTPSIVVGDGAYGDLEVAPDGAVHVVLAEADPGPGALGSTENRIVYRASGDGGRTFSDASVVSAAGDGIPFFFSNPQVVADPARRRVHVIYPAGTPDGRWDIWLATSADAGRTWARVKVNDDAPCASHMTPTAVLDPRSGRVHAIWLENRTGAGGVAYASCASDAASGRMVCAANEAVSSAPFAGYELGRFGPGWLGEYPSLVLDGERRTLHAVWAQTVDESGVATARIFHAAARI